MTNLDQYTIDLYAEDSTEELREMAEQYQREADMADNETRREMAQADADLYSALVAQRSN